MEFKFRSKRNPIEKYMEELRLSKLLDGYSMANGIIIDPATSKELLKAEMKRVEAYLAAREEIGFSRKLR